MITGEMFWKPSVPKFFDGKLYYYSGVLIFDCKYEVSMEKIFYKNKWVKKKRTRNEKKKLTFLKTMNSC